MHIPTPLITPTHLHVPAQLTIYVSHPQAHPGIYFRRFRDPSVFLDLHPTVTRCFYHLWHSLLAISTFTIVRCVFNSWIPNPSFSLLVFPFIIVKTYLSIHLAPSPSTLYALWLVL